MSSFKCFVSKRDGWLLLITRNKKKTFFSRIKNLGAEQEGECQKGCDCIAHVIVIHVPCDCIAHVIVIHVPCDCIAHGIVIHVPCDCIAHVIVIHVPCIWYCFVLWPTNAHKLSHSYMFRHYRAILRQLAINTLPSHTSISHPAVGNTVYH
jgi:hypothetical protein